MTDEQIIKALERSALKCTPYEIVNGNGLYKSTLNLINRQKEKIKEFDEKIVIQQGMIDYQKAEIEIYKGAIKTLKNDVANAKYEAIKEFAERLKDKIWYSSWCNLERTITPEIITSLVKEMTEEEK